MNLPLFIISPEIVTHFRTFHIGNLTFYGYGIIIGIATVTSLILFLRSLWQKDRDAIPPTIVVTMISAIAGGRLFYVLGNLGDFTSNLFSVFYLWEGGITIFGIIFGGIAGNTSCWRLFSMRKKWNHHFFYFLDSALPFVAIGQAIGRWGNFVNEELYGIPTNQTWGLFVSPQYRVSRYHEYNYFHPAFLYESALDLFLFLLLFCVVRRKQKTALVTGVYAMGYGVIRLLVEFVRYDSTVIWGTLTYSRVGALILIFCGIAVLFYANTQDRKQKK